MCLLSGPLAWAFSAWKQTRGKAEGGDASQNPSPLYSQQGAWNCSRVPNMQLQERFLFIQFSTLHKKSQLYFALLKRGILLWAINFAVELVMDFQKELSWAIFNASLLRNRAWYFLAHSTQVTEILGTGSSNYFLCPVMHQNPINFFRDANAIHIHCLYFMVFIWRFESCCSDKQRSIWLLAGKRNNYSFYAISLQF